MNYLDLRIYYMTILFDNDITEDWTATPNRHSALYRGHHLFDLPRSRACVRLYLLHHVFDILHIPQRDDHAQGYNARHEHSVTYYSGQGLGGSFLDAHCNVYGKLFIIPWNRGVRMCVWIGLYVRVRVYVLYYPSHYL